MFALMDMLWYEVLKCLDSNREKFKFLANFLSGNRKMTDEVFYNILMADSCF